MSEDWLDPPANIIGDWSLGGVVYEPLAHVSTPSPTNELLPRSILKYTIKYHYRNPLLCRAPEALPLGKASALGKEGLAERPINGSRQ
jgi:hypothetical protein